MYFFFDYSMWLNAGVSKPTCVFPYIPEGWHSSSCVYIWLCLLWHELLGNVRLSAKYTHSLPQGVCTSRDHDISIFVVYRML